MYVTRVRFPDGRHGLQVEHDDVPHYDYYVDGTCLNPSDYPDWAQIKWKSQLLDLDNLEGVDIDDVFAQYSRTL